MSINKLQKLLTIALTVVVFSACGSQVEPSDSEPITIKIAVLPVLDTLPMYVAQENDLFAKQDLTVEFIPAGSAPKRDELVSSGQVDGMINEIVSTVFYNREETRVQIVRFARTSVSDSAIFRILASSKSGIKQIDDLKNIPIGVSKGTVIEYLTDRLLQSEGFSQSEINVVAVPDIGQRMSLLVAGELPSAMLPDPLASLSISQGAQVIIEDSKHPQYSNSVYTFRKAFIDQNPQAIKRFLSVIEEAVNLLNQNPQQFSHLLSKYELVPPSLSSTFDFPDFVEASIPSEEQWDDVVNWIDEKGLNPGKASYEDSVTAEYLP
jgi:NitT/TauT family transport system substrate-binding protein